MYYEFDDVVVADKGLQATAESEEMIVPDCILVVGDNWSTQIDTNDHIYLIDKDQRTMISGVVTELYEDGGVSIDNEYCDINAYNILMKVKG